VKATSTKYFCVLALLGATLAGCQTSFAPQQTPSTAYEITGRDGTNRGVIHIVSADETQVEWDAWLDWRDGGQSARSVFHASIKLGKSGKISKATISRHPAETLQITVLPDRLHCELTEGSRLACSFDIVSNGAALFIPPLSFPANTENILCFDPFSWDYVVVRVSVESLESTGLYLGGKRVGIIKRSGGLIEAWELPMVSVARGGRIGFDAEAVPAAAVITPVLSAQDLARLSTLTAEFELTLPRDTTWKWSNAGDFIYDANNCKGEWLFSNKVSPAKPAGKAHSSEETEWGVNPAQLATFQALPGQSPKPAAIPSSPLSVLLRGMGDDGSRAWLAATLAQGQGWRARIAGGIVLRPGRDYVPVITQWAEILRDGTIQVMDADVATGFYLRLWTAPQLLAGIDGRIKVRAVQIASPAPWSINPPIAGNQTWQWELSRDGSLLGSMSTIWQASMTSSRPTINISYQGDSMNLPLAGNFTLEVDSGGHVWGYLSPELTKSPWLLLALCKGWMLCPAGNGTVAGLSFYFASRDDNGWLPPLLWADGQPAEVREAGEGTYSDGKELRSVKRYRIDPPGLLVSAAEGGELMEVKGEFGTWHRVNLNPVKLMPDH